MAPREKGNSLNNLVLYLLFLYLVLISVILCIACLLLLFSCFVCFRSYCVGFCTSISCAFVILLAGLIFFSVLRQVCVIVFFCLLLASSFFI